MRSAALWRAPAARMPVTPAATAGPGASSAGAQVSMAATAARAGRTRCAREPVALEKTRGAESDAH